VPRKAITDERWIELRQHDFAKGTAGVNEHFRWRTMNSTALGLEKANIQYQESEKNGISIEYWAQSTGNPNVV